MSLSTNQRAKLLYLMKILLEKTDMQNPLTMSGIITELAVYGIKSERKSIYTDIEILRQFGLDIETSRSKTTNYFIANRRFELHELKLLVDAVQSSRFITEKNSNELMSKLFTLTSEAQAKHLKRQIYVDGRVKSFNEKAYYSVDAIHTAINNKKKITFKYFNYNVQKKRVYRKGGSLYQVTPLTLCWNDDKYYLVAYNAEHNELRNYRVDRMSEVLELGDNADSFDKSKFNIAKHIKSVFGMFSGEVVCATLSFDNAFVNVVLDYFGKETKLIPKGNERFEIKVDVSVSPVFLGWMFQFGEGAEIIAPDSLVAAMRELISIGMKKYVKLSV